MGIHCREAEHKEEQKMSDCVNVYEAKTCNIDSYAEILKTRPPCI